MVEVTIKFSCPEKVELKTTYILNLFTAISGIKFTRTDSSPDILYGAADEPCSLNVPFIEYEIMLDDWQLFNGRNRLVLPQFIQPESLKLTDRQIGLDLFSLMYSFLETGLKNIEKEIWSTDRIRTNLYFTYPFFNSYAQYLVEIMKQAQIIPESFSPASPWPVFAPFAVGLSHDLDIFKRKVPGSVRILAQAAFSDKVPGGMSGSLKGFYDSFAGAVTFGKNPYDQFDTWLKSDGSSTYFVFAGDRKSSKDPTYNPAKVGRRLKGLDFEIALHNGIGTWKNAGDLAKAQNKLSEIFDNPIEGIRPHYLDFSLPEFWANAGGFRYSSSIGSDKVPGFSCGVNFPLQGLDLESGEPLDILEMPIGLMDCALFSIKEKILRERAIQDIINCCNSTHGLLVLDWHSRSAYEPDFPGWFATYNAILDTARAAGAYIAPLGEIARYWRNHCISAL